MADTRLNPDRVALRAAISAGDGPAVIAMLRRDPSLVNLSVDETAADNVTPLGLAIMMTAHLDDATASYAMVELLLRRGADPDIAAVVAPRVGPALTDAAARRAQGRSVYFTHETGYRYYATLWSAFMLNKTTLSTLLLRWGADPHLTDSLGQSQFTYILHPDRKLHYEATFTTAVVARNRVAARAARHELARVVRELLLKQA